MGHPKFFSKMWFNAQLLGCQHACGSWGTWLWVSYLGSVQALAQILPLKAGGATRVQSRSGRAAVSCTGRAQKQPLTPGWEEIKARENCHWGKLKQKANSNDASEEVTGSFSGKGSRSGVSEQHLLHKVEIQQSKSKLGKDEGIPRKYSALGARNHQGLWWGCEWIAKMGR